MLWLLIRIALAYVVGAHYNGKMILMSTHNIGFYEEISKIITQVSPNIIKYTPYLFFCNSRSNALSE